MDLLTGYGSGSESEREGDIPNPILTSRTVVAVPAVASTAAAAPLAAAKKPSLSGSLPGFKSAAPAAASGGKIRADLPPGFFDSPAAAAPISSSAAPAGLPSNFFDAASSSTAVAYAAAGAANDAEAAAPGPAVRPPPAAVADLPQPSDPQLWSKLPAANKRKVTLRPKIDMALLAASDSDDDDAASAAKKAKPAAAAGKPSILSFLPAPKHAPKGPKGGSSRLLGGGGGTRLDTAGGSGWQQQQQQQHSEDDGGQQAALGPAAVSNEAYRMRPAATAAAAAATADDDSSSGGYHYAAQLYEQQQYDEQQYYQQFAAAGSEGAAAGYDYSAYYQSSVAAPAAAGATRSTSSAAAMHPEEALLQEALQAEAAKAARRGAGAGSSQLVMPDIQFKEVKADSIKYVDPAQREAAQGMRAALGADYAAKLRAEATPHAGSKLARSKHQIGTLFANAKLRELEVLENRAAGMKSKAETAGKYGWR